MCCECKKASFVESVKPYRKFFRGKDLCLNRGCEEKGGCADRGFGPWERLAVRQDRPAGTPCFHLRPSAFNCGKKGNDMKARHGKIARLMDLLHRPELREWVRTDWPSREAELHDLKVYNGISKYIKVIKGGRAK